MTRKRRVGSIDPDQLAIVISEGIERAYEAAALDLESTINAWRNEVEGIFEQWACDSDDECPGKPAWMRDLREALWLPGPEDKLPEHVADTVRAWLMQRLMAFAQAHPEARLAPVEYA